MSSSRTEAALSLGLLLLAATAGPQTTASYRTAVERYRSGGTDEAVKEVSSWPGEDLHREAREAFRKAGRGVDFPVAAAAMLHTDCARLAAERSDAWTFDVRIGEAAAFVQVLQGRANGASFARRWYLAVGYDLMALSATVRARRLFEDGLRRFPEDRDLRLAVGSVAEMEGSRGALARAEGEYRRVLEVDPEVGEAHLRRGRVLGELGRTDEALRELEWVRQRSDDPRLRYLGFLFQGRVEESAGHLEAAVASYRSAAAQDPAGQTGHLALAHALEALGDRAGAADSLAAAAPAASRRHDDGWWVYCFGHADRVGAMLDELRREAAQ